MSTKPYRMVLHHPDARDVLALDGHAVVALVEVEPNAWTLSVRGANGHQLALMLATLIAKVGELDEAIVDLAIRHLEDGNVPDTAFTRHYNRGRDAH